MRFIIMLTTMLVLALGQLTSPPLVRAQAEAVAVGGMAISGVIEQLSDLARQLESSARTLLEQGNNALAQQQMLLSGIIQGLVTQLETTYADSLQKTFEEIGTAEYNAAADLLRAVDLVQKLETKTAADIQATIYSLQGAANQLLNKIPLVKRYPVFYGVSARDLLTNPGESPADIEILGFLLADAKLKFKKPVVHVAGLKLPDQNISVRDDRILLQLPSDVKNRIEFGNLPCSPRKTFPMRMQVFFGKTRGIWPIMWTGEDDATFTANALPGADLFTISVTVEGIRRTNSTRQESYSSRSGQVTFQCEETRNAAAVVNLPEGAREIQCNSEWIETSNTSGRSQNCTVGGTVVSATGSITGRNRECYIVGDVVRGLTFGIVNRRSVCNCPGGGHGSLRVFGTYKVTVDTVSNEKYELNPPVTMTGVHAFATLPSDSSFSASMIMVDIKRQRCSEIFDRFVIAVPDNPNLGINHTSENGIFKATYRLGQLTIDRLN